MTVEGVVQAAGLDRPGAITAKRRRAMLIISLGELLDGYLIVITAGALILIKPQFNLPASLTGLLGASVFIGAALGMIVLGDVSDRIGRRRIFVVNLLAFVGLSIVSAFVQNVPELMAVRFLLGIAIGADVPTSMAFLNELAPKKSRGAWGGALPNIMWGIGAAGAAFIWLPLLGTGPNAWRWAFGLAAAPALLIWVGRQTLPESPRWLIAQGRTEDAERVLAEFGVETSISGQAPTAGSPAEARPRRDYRELFSRGYGPRLGAVCGLVILNGLSGPVTTVATPYILRYVGLLSVRDSLLFSGLVWLANLAGSSSCWFLLDRLPRRKLVIWTQATNGVLVVAMALFGRGHPYVLVPLFFVFGYLQWAAAIPAIWLWGTELFPTRVRAAGQGITNGVNRLAVAASIFLVPVALGAAGFPALMIGFAVLTFLFAITVASIRFFATNDVALETLSP